VTKVRFREQRRKTFRSSRYFTTRSNFLCCISLLETTEKKGKSLVFSRLHIRWLNSRKNLSLTFKLLRQSNIDAIALIQNKASDKRAESQELRPTSHWTQYRRTEVTSSFVLLSTSAMGRRDGSNYVFSYLVFILLILTPTWTDGMLSLYCVNASTLAATFASRSIVASCTFDLQPQRSHQLFSSN
jgi:hypothetical protein